MNCDICKKETEKPNSVVVSSWKKAELRLLVDDKCYQDILGILLLKCEANGIEGSNSNLGVHIAVSYNKGDGKS